MEPQRDTERMPSFARCCSNAENCSAKLGICLRRKIKCDGLLPACHNCIKAKKDCRRPKSDRKYVFHCINPIYASKAIAVQAKFCGEQSQDLVAKANLIASSSPQEALENEVVTELLVYYVNILAPWYDLNDCQLNFARIVPLHALDNPVLFKALVAFSASHRSKVHGSTSELATAFHLSCIGVLLQHLEGNGSDIKGDYLAATCLLRSYEILNSDSRKEQRHLLGAYSFTISDSIKLGDYGLPQAGAWNYLREEITVALECRRPVRMGDNSIWEGEGDLTDDMLANLMSYHLAKIINFCFDIYQSHCSPDDRVMAWHALKSDLTTWRNNLPPTFNPFSTAPKAGNIFPSIWMVQPWHIAAQQYYSVAEILLTLYNPTISESTLAEPERGFVQDHALRVCGLAFTNDNLSARVNAFGPLSFCGRCLTEEKHRDGLLALLIAMSIPAAWPIDQIIQDLKVYWGF